MDTIPLTLHVKTWDRRQTWADYRTEQMLSFGKLVDKLHESQSKLSLVIDGRDEKSRLLQLKNEVLPLLEIGEISPEDPRYVEYKQLQRKLWAQK